MGKDILGMYSNNSMPAKSPKANSMVDNGGRPNCRDVMNYSSPVIPGWDPKGSMGPGIGGTVRRAGSQGPALAMDNDGGRPGIKRSGGEGQGMGTNRKG